MLSLLVTGAGLPIATAALLTYVGVLVARRDAPGEARAAMRMFATWWFSAAAILVMVGLPTLLSYAGVTDIAVYTLISYVLCIPLALGLCGLLYYLAYIYTGHAGALRWLAVAYALFFMFAVYYTTAAGPRHLVETAWSVRAIGVSRPPAWRSILFGVLLAGPILGAVVAYASLLFRLTDRAQRTRVAMVSGAFGLWFTPILLGFVLGWDGKEWFPLVYQSPGIVAAALIVAAYRRPDATPAGRAGGGV